MAKRPIAGIETHIQQLPSNAVQVMDTAPHKEPIKTIPERIQLVARNLDHLINQQRKACTKGPDNMKRIIDLCHLIIAQDDMLKRLLDAVDKELKATNQAALVMVPHVERLGRGVKTGSIKPMPRAKRWADK